MPPYSAVRESGLDTCGLAQLASRTVGVPFAGLIAATLAIFRPERTHCPENDLGRGQGGRSGHAQGTAPVACETHLSRVECVTVGRSGRLSGFVVVRVGGNPDRPLPRRPVVPPIAEGWRSALGLE